MSVEEQVDEIFEPIQEEYDGGEPMLPGTIPQAKHQILALIKQARIDGGKDVFDCMRDLFAKVPEGMPQEDYDLLHWHAKDLHDMQDDLEKDWLKQLTEDK